MGNNFFHNFTPLLVASKLQSHQLSKTVRLPIKKLQLKLRRNLRLKLRRLFNRSTSIHSNSLQPTVKQRQSTELPPRKSVMETNLRKPAKSDA